MSLTDENKSDGASFSTGTSGIVIVVMVSVTDLTYLALSSLGTNTNL